MRLGINTSLYIATMCGPARLAFGEPLVPRYQFERADVILAIDCDFLTQLPGAVRYVRDFGHRRKPPFASHADIGKDASQADNRPQPMNRLYAIESTPTLVGAVADHRWPLRAGDVEGCVRDLARRLGVSVAETMSDRRFGSEQLAGRGARGDRGRPRGASGLEPWCSSATASRRRFTHLRMQSIVN